MKVGVVGIGYVGLPTAVCLASFGHQIICLDTDENKIKQLQENKLPIFEKGLEQLYKTNKNKIRFTVNYEDLKSVDIIIIAVGTPQLETGEADLSYIYSVAKSLKLTNGQIVAIKSTVPIGTNDKVLDILKQNNKVNFDLISIPEFLREGFAIKDFYNPDRIIIGVRNYNLYYKIKKLYSPSLRNKIILTDIKSAELIKYASNAFLATKIHFINEIANLCEVTGANIRAVSVGMGADTRIGHKFLKAGAGYGGSCFPKDTEALLYTANNAKIDLNIVKTVIEGNKQRKIELANRILNKIKNLKNPTITFLGIAFKTGTDDCRESSSIAIIKYIQDKNKNVQIRCYDALANNNARKILDNVIFYDNLMASIKDTNLIIIMNEDEEFRTIKTDKPIFDYRGIMPNSGNVYKIGENNFNA